MDGNEFSWEPLAEMQGLQHPHMDDNDFTPRESPTAEETGESIGAIAILESLEMNKSLLSLKMGELNNLRSFYQHSWSTLPHYNTALCKNNLAKMDANQERNREVWEVSKESRFQQAVVIIAEILLSKLANDVE